MEEEVTQRTIALSIRTAKLTGNVLRAALRKFLAAQHQKGKNPYKQGKQTVKELIGQNAGVSNIEINDGNIKSFERVAKKYGIDYALKKDKSENPPKYLVFFKGRDTDVLNQAFKEYVGKQMKQKDKPSIMEKLTHFKEQEPRAGQRTPEGQGAELMMNLKPDAPCSQKKGEKGHRSRASPKQKSKQFSFSIPADSIPGKVIADVRAFVQEKINSLQSLDKKKLFLTNFPYLIFGYFTDKIAWLYRVSDGATGWDKLMETLNYFERAFADPFPSVYYMDLLYGFAGGVVIKMIVYYRSKNAKKYRQGVEYGSARWGTEKDIQPYKDPVFENNIILTATERLMMSGRPKEPKYARNKNILVIGGGGWGGGGACVSAVPVPARLAFL